jgi:hypothetical protein
MTYQCPVCGYDGMRRPPTRYAICPCCGTEFSNDDQYATHDELRSNWISRGAAWWSAIQRPPFGWSARSQLTRAGYVHEAQRVEPKVSLLSAGALIRAGMLTTMGSGASGNVRASDPAAERVEVNSATISPRFPVHA